MKTTCVLLFACAALGVTLYGPASRAEQRAPKPEPVACAFANPRYVGNCVEKVTPEEKQTPVQACTAILNCLNNAQCVKTYCQSTTVRGGWTLVSPKEKEKAR
jgi:hypothetical protein